MPRSSPPPRRLILHPVVLAVVAAAWAPAGAHAYSITLYADQQAGSTKNAVYMTGFDPHPKPIESISSSATGSFPSGFANGSSSADVYNGSVHAVGISGGIFPDYIPLGSYEYADFAEHIYITLPGKAVGQPSDIGFNAHADGTYSLGFDPGPSSVYIRPGVASQYTLRVLDQTGYSYMEGHPSYDADFSHEVTIANGNAPVVTDTTSLLYGDHWASSSYTTLLDGDVVNFAGQFEVFGPVVTLDIDESLVALTGGNASDDWSNTGYLTITLPVGASFTSSSGVFLSQPIGGGSSVPEPASMSLLVVGLAGAASSRWVLRKKPVK